MEKNNTVHCLKQASNNSVIPFLNVRAAESHSGKTLLVNEILKKIGGRRI